MSADALMAMGFGGSALAGMNAVLWLGQGISEARWRFIGDAGAYCFRRMWLNFALAIILAGAGIAGLAWRV